MAKNEKLDVVVAAGEKRQTCFSQPGRSKDLPMQCCVT